MNYKIQLIFINISIVIFFNIFNKNSIKLIKFLIKFNNPIFSIKEKNSKKKNCINEKKCQKNNKQKQK